MTELVARLRELDRIVSQGGWVLLLPDDTIKEPPEHFSHLRLSKENTLAEAANKLEYLQSQVDRIRAILGCEP